MNNILKWRAFGLKTKFKILNKIYFLKNCEFGFQTLEVDLKLFGTANQGHLR